MITCLLPSPAALALVQLKPSSRLDFDIGMYKELNHVKKETVDVIKFFQAGMAMGSEVSAIAGTIDNKAANLSLSADIPSMTDRPPREIKEPTRASTRLSRLSRPSRKRKKSPCSTLAVLHLLLPCASSTTSGEPEEDTGSSSPCLRQPALPSALQPNSLLAGSLNFGVEPVASGLGSSSEHVEHGLAASGLELRSRPGLGSRLGSKLGLRS